jgi:hypothetical protein
LLVLERKDEEDKNFCLLSFAVDTVAFTQTNTDYVNFCLLPLLLLWISDGPIPMRFMGGTKNIFGGRCYIKSTPPTHPALREIALHCTATHA